VKLLHKMIFGGDFHAGFQLASLDQASQLIGDLSV
jgi:hypothetical protein